MPAKAQNKRKRRHGAGRPKHEYADRTPSGQKSRSKAAKAAAQRETQRQIMDTAMNARMRHTGLSEKQAKNPQAGTALGLLLLDKHITDEQFKAGEHYCEAMFRYYRLSGVPLPSAAAQNLFAIKGYGGDVTDEQADAAKSAANYAQRLRGVLLSCGHEGRKIAEDVHEVCVLDAHTYWLNEKGRRMWDTQTTRLVAKGLSAIAKEMG